MHSQKVIIACVCRIHAVRTYEAHERRKRSDRRENRERRERRDRWESRQIMNRKHKRKARKGGKGGAAKETRRHTPLASDAMVVPHLTKVIKSGLNGGEEGHLKIKQIDLVRVVKHLFVVKAHERVPKRLSHVLLHKPPNVLDTAVLSGLALT